MQDNSAYAVLGIPKGSSDRDIKSAYVALVKQFDPERHTEKFMVIQGAYDRLRTTKSRAKEDVFSFNEVTGEYLYGAEEQDPTAAVPTEVELQNLRNSYAESGGNEENRKALIVGLLRAAKNAEQKKLLKAALKLWEEVLELDPTHLRARNNIEHGSQIWGFELVRAERYPEAVNAWERALQFNPDSTAIIQNLAIVAEKAKDPGRAGRYWGELVARWKSLLETNEDTEYLRYCIVEALNHHGEFIDVQSLKTPTPQASGPAESQVANPKINDGVGSSSTTASAPKMNFLDRLREMVRLRPDDTDLRMQLANRLMEEKKFADAAEELMALAKKENKSVPVLNLLGWALLNSGKKDEAFSIWKRSLTLDPKNAATKEQVSRAHLLMGKSYRAKGLFTPALVHFKQLKAMLPNNAEVHLELAATYDMKGDVRAATAEYNNVLTLDPKNPVARKAINDLRMKR